MPDVSLIAVVFAEAIEFLRDRLQIDEQEWTRLMAAAETAAAQAVDRAEEAMRRDLRAAATDILQRGGTLADFRKDYERIVAGHGWSAGDGQAAWHAELVFRMETANAYNAGRWAQIQRNKRTRPYIRYLTVLDNRVRFEHRQWHGIVLPVDHPFWLTHWPPNGFNCRCTVQSLNARDLTRYGYSITADDDPALAIPPDEGFAGNVGIAWDRWRNGAETV